MFEKTSVVIIFARDRSILLSLILAGSFLAYGMRGFTAETLTLPLRLGPVSMYKPLVVTFSELADPGMKNGESSIGMTIKDSKTGQLEVQFAVLVSTPEQAMEDGSTEVPKTTVSVDQSKPARITDPYYNAQEVLAPGNAAYSILTGVFNANYKQKGV